jgi:hypothetical protein
MRRRRPAQFRPPLGRQRRDARGPPGDFTDRSPTPRPAGGAASGSRWSHDSDDQPPTGGADGLSLVRRSSESSPAGAGRLRLLVSSCVSVLAFPGDLPGAIPRGGRAVTEPREEEGWSSTAPGIPDLGSRGAGQVSSGASAGAGRRPRLLPMRRWKRLRPNPREPIYAADVHLRRPGSDRSDEAGSGREGRLTVAPGHREAKNRAVKRSRNPPREPPVGHSMDTMVNRQRGRGRQMRQLPLHCSAERPDPDLGDGRPEVLRTGPGATPDHDAPSLLCPRLPPRLPPGGGGPAEQNEGSGRAGFDSAARSPGW